MKLIDILVEELPKRGGWPADSDEMSQSQFDCEIYTNSKLMPDFYVGERAEDNGIDNGITREQYEAALADKNEGWIEWGGGVIPISTNTFVDVKFNNGDVRLGKIAGEYSWEHIWQGSNIIAYRLHKPQEAAQPKADEEADLNECIGQDGAPVWSGEGLPPVGCECEYKWQNDRWRIGRVCYISKHTVLMLEIFDGEESESAYGACDVTFRPIRSEADRKRDDICDKIYGAMTNAKRKDNRSDMAEEIYDAIAAGKIHGVKLDD